ncbi:hypothetical protein HOD75_00310 [archaeon]|jgi:hypothetical protein|nr:hypothetical protein [archaeon]MBT4241318.1 hypothetical protein [archaeon]MBT4418139.1 hypothetical protein [archaeon]
MDFGFLIIITIFLVYYFAVLIIERNIIQEPTEIIEKFLSVTLMYAGISLIYFSMTGKPFLGDSEETYNVYIFIIGFIALLWTIPNLLDKFGFFHNFLNGKQDKKKVVKQVKRKTLKK